MWPHDTSAFNEWKDSFRWVIHVRRVVQIALVSEFAAMIAVSYFIPLSVILGGIGFFKLTWVLQTLTGILLGPWLGGSAALIGSLFGNVFSPSPFGPFGLLLPVTAAFQAGLLAWGYQRGPALIIGGLTVLWLVVPAGSGAWPVVFFYIAGIILMLGLGKKSSRTVMESSRPHVKVISWMIIAYSANITRHVFGNILSATILNLPTEAFMGAIPLTIIEQVFFALGSAIIGIPLLMAIERSNVTVPLLEKSRNVPGEPEPEKQEE